MGKKNGGYRELKIIDNWNTRIELGGEPLDFGKYYDIKIPKGKLFIGCKIYQTVNEHRGLGGMSEDSTEIIPFFEANGLEVKLKSGFWMRVNERVTSQKQAEIAEKTRQNKLQALYEERDELDQRIADLESE